MSDTATLNRQAAQGGQPIPSYMPTGSLAFRWGFAIVAVLTALVVVLALEPFLPREIVFAVFPPVVLLTALWAGTGPAAAAALVSCVLAWQLYVQEPEPPATEAVVFLFLGLLSGTGILVVHLMRRALVRLAMAEATASAEARQHNLLFTELQHRVANNLSVLASLLSMQQRQLIDPASRRALAEAATRLEVVSRLSRLLHDPKGQEVEVGAFLRSVVPEVIVANNADERVAVDLNFDEVVVSAPQTVPLGLIATELLSNAIEHGFPEGEGGRIKVTLRRTGASMACLIVQHDGEGLPPGFRLSEVRSLGLTVAKQLANQLKAELMIVQDKEVVSRLTFPLDDLGADQAILIRAAQARPDRPWTGVWSNLWL